MQTPAQPYAISIKEACQRLGISRYTVTRLIRAHAFHAIKVGRRVIIPVDSLSDWLHGEQQSQGMTSW